MKLERRLAWALAGSLVLSGLAACQKHDKTAGPVEGEPGATAGAEIQAHPNDSTYGGSLGRSPEPSTGDTTGGLEAEQRAAEEAAPSTSAPAESGR